MKPAPPPPPPSQGRSAPSPERSAFSPPPTRSGIAPPSVPSPGVARPQTQTTHASADRPLAIEPIAAPGGDASLQIAWRPIQLGAQHSQGCTIRSSAGHALSVLIEQGAYRKTLTGTASIEVTAIPVAPEGVEGRLTAHDEQTGAAAQYAWLWQPPGGRKRPQNFTLQPAAAAARQAAKAQKAAQSGAAASGATTSFFGQPAQGHRIAFILDMSGSMAGQRWAACRQQLIIALQALRGQGEFFVVLFSDHLVEPPNQLDWTLADAGVVDAVIAWTGAVVPVGGTMPRPAFERVFSLSAAPDAVYFLTDGQFSDCTAADIERLNNAGSASRFGALALGLGRSLLGKPKEQAGAVINTIALDDAGGARVLEAIAQSSGGQYTHATSG